MQDSIIRKFGGLFDTRVSVPDLQGLADLFDFIRPRADGQRMDTAAEHVIRDSASFDRFIDQVPTRKMQHVRHPEPNDDPILQRPQVDFENHMVLAVVTHDANRFVGVDIVGVEMASETTRVFCHFAEPEPPCQKIISYGYYCAAVVPRYDGKVVFAGE